jgi:hypothetical protein
MLDLFAIARGNGASLQRDFDATIAALAPAETAVVEEFARWVEGNSTVSMNVRLFVVVELVNGRPFQNIYEWAEEQARLSRRDVDEILRERLHVFYEKRVAFDASFVEGRRFRYGALNAGGTGLVAYAPYCVILKSEFCRALQPLAYLPGDSLQLAFTSDGSFDSAAVISSATADKDRHLMAATNLGAEAAATAPSVWPELVCRARYFEAIFIGDVEMPAVSCVRIPRAEYKRVWDMAFDSFSRKLSDGERAMVHDFVQIRRAELGGKLRVEVVD